MNNLINIKAIDSSLLDDALNSFEYNNGYDFMDLLTNDSTQQEYYNKNKNRNFDKYIEESKEIYTEINLIMNDLEI